jgi:transcriptional regulator with XRE-family HTH domain
MDDAEFAKQIGANIRAARAAAGLTQKQLAGAAGLFVPQLSRMEKGSTGGPKVSTLKRIADVLGVRVCQLIDPPPPAPKPRKAK